MTTATKATPRRCEVADLFTVKEGDADALRPVAEYFAQFYAPIIPEKGTSIAFGWRCVCGEALTGLFGTFTYGLAHGEGRCDACGHPGRADHYVKDAAGEDVLALNRCPLLYAPADDAPTTEAP